MIKEVQIEKIEVLTEKEAAKYIRMSRSFLSQDRMNGYREGRTPIETLLDGKKIWQEKVDSLNLN